MTRKVQAKRSDTLNDKDYAVWSVEKALRLLSAFSLSTPCWSVSDLAREQGLPKSTAHNLLRTLQRHDLVRQDPEDRTYRLGPRAMEMGLVFARSTETLSLARPILRRLAEQSRETVKLGLLSGDEVLIVAAIESTHQLHTRGDIGTRWPLHSTSLGKAILSALPLPEAKALVEKRGMTKFTPQTFTSWTRLGEELDAIRSRGYALDQEENEAGVRCVAAPFVDTLRGTVAAVSLSGPSVRLDGDALARFARDVVSAAQKIGPRTN